MNIHYPIKYPSESAIIKILLKSYADEQQTPFEKFTAALFHLFICNYHNINSLKTGKQTVRDNSLNIR